MKRIVSHKAFAALSTYMWRGFTPLFDLCSDVRISNQGQPATAGHPMIA